MPFDFPNISLILQEFIIFSFVVRVLCLSFLILFCKTILDEDFELHLHFSYAQIFLSAPCSLSIPLHKPFTEQSLGCNT